MTMRTTIPAAALLGCLTGQVWAQFSNDPVTNHIMRQAAGIKSIGDYVAEGIAAAGQLAVGKAVLSAQLLSARDAFWAEYPSGPGFVQAATKFAGLLKTKDAYYLTIYMQLDNPTIQGIEILTGDIDGGIQKGARKAFTIWANEVKKNAGGLQLNAKTIEMLMNPQKAAAAREKAEPFYRDYLLRRDWEEFRSRGLKPPNIEPGFWDQVLFGFKLRDDAGITDREANIDPYTYAFEAWQRRDVFANGCAAYITQLTRKAPAEVCQCVQNVFAANLAPRELSNINAEFTEEHFLFTAVSQVGLHEKVAACLR